MQTYRINKEIADQIEKKYYDYKKDNTNEYISFICSYNSNVITIYINKDRTPSKCTVAGPEELTIFKDFNIEPTVKKEKIIKEADHFIYTSSQIGSDEVGFGDFFGPIIVTATFCDEKTLKLINEYGLKDSKKITDEKIMNTIPKLIDKVIFSQLIVNNEKLTELFEKNYNLNQIKSILHNQVLANVKKSISNIGIKEDNIKFFIDKFTEEKAYYKYVSNEKEIIKNIEFRCKGESAFPSVALASCIARYTFIIKMREIGKKYGVSIPFGASSNVDNFAKEFIKKFGLAELKKIVKTNFSNYSKLLD